jgi:hypothetical protein
MYLVLRLPDSERVCNKKRATSPRTPVFVRSTAVHGRDVLGASESKSIVDARRPAHDDQNLLRNKYNQ